MIEKVRDMLAFQLDIDKSEIKSETDIFDDLGADSLDIVELLSALEEEYGIVITDESVNEVRTVKDIADFIEMLI